MLILDLLFSGFFSFLVFFDLLCSVCCLMYLINIYIYIYRLCFGWLDNSFILRKKKKDKNFNDHNLRLCLVRIMIILFILFLLFNFAYVAFSKKKKQRLLLDLLDLMTKKSSSLLQALPPLLPLQIQSTT